MHSRFDSVWGQYQAEFHAHWSHLCDPHVRALTWLLDAPQLLDPLAQQWKGQIAVLHDAQKPEVKAWLAALDRAPQELHAALDLRPATRLGRYAENLMAFYLERQGVLAAHGIQVRADQGHTVGEFDFLLEGSEGLTHWEFATKFYLLAPEHPLPGTQTSDYFIGPNLADSLGTKMRKVLERQLSLARHPAAQAYLPKPVVIAQALVKGWLFYALQVENGIEVSGVMPTHCRGFWCASSELDAIDGELFVVLPRLSWLAPAKASLDSALDKGGLRQFLQTHYANDSMPVLVASVAREREWLLERTRGFIVPEEWRLKARQSMTERLHARY